MAREPSNAGGFQAPGTLGIGVSDLEAISNKFQTESEVEAELVMLGIPEVKKPEHELPEITAASLTTTNSQEYTTMYAQQLAWANYLGPILAKVTSNLAQAENQMKLIKAKIEETASARNKLLQKQDRLKESEIENSVLNDVIYQEAMLEAQKYKQLKLRLEAAHEIAGRNLRIISRQVEIRRQEIDGALLEGGIPNRGRVGMQGPGGPHRPIGGVR